MRLKITILLAACIFGAGEMIGQQTGYELARVTAEQWLIKKKAIRTTNIQLSDSVTEAGRTLFYRFSLNPDGFIWVSADFRSAPVLAYSFNGPDPSLIPNHPVEDFIQTYREQISGMLSSADDQVLPHEGWSQLQGVSLKSGNTDDVVEPMMEVLWGQGSGYNALTPDNTPTGCVAVSMVQIMRHWEWPVQPKGQHSYTHNVYGDFAIDLDTITFDWANMPLTAPSIEVAQAMFYTGIALHMGYAPGGSGAFTDRAGNLMESSFGFHEKARYTAKDDYGATNNWVRVIKNELINGRPMIYSGHGTGGHAFNFDGFDGDYFHVNWGWSGSQNGYFLVTALSPGSNDFSEAQAAVINLFPDYMLMWDRPYNIRILAGDSRVSLGWSAVFNSELAHYNIYRDGELVGQTPDRYFTDTTAANGAVYSYSVSAVYRTDSADYESVRTLEKTVQPAAGFAVPFSETFEEGHDGWQIASTPLGFRWGTQSDLGMGSDTENYFIGINSGAAGNNKLVSDYMISNGFNFEGMSHVILSFDYAFRKWQDVDHLYLMYRRFEENVWIEIQELDATKGYHDWVNYKTYLPAGALTGDIQLAFFYTDNGGVGYGAGIDNIEIIEQSDPGKPEFSASENDICLNTEVIFTDNSQGNIQSYSWDFGLGADPRYADTQGPHHVIYKSSGEKTVTLVLNGLDKKVKENYLTIVRPPNAAFSKTINYKTVTFRNTSSNATTYFWNFGDGVQVMQESPIHTYAKSGDYLVTLVAINNTCANDTTQQWISFKVTGVEDLIRETDIQVFPNPVDDFLTIRKNDEQTTIDRVELVDIQGKIVELITNSATLSGSSIQVNLSHFQQGIYFLIVHLEDRVVHHKIIRN